MKIPFGKFRNQDVSDVDLPYLKWVEEFCKNIDPELRAAVQHEIRRRSGDVTSLGRDVKRKYVNQTSA